MLKPIVLISALLLALAPQVHSRENGTNILIKSDSAFDYRMTRKRLLKAITDNGLVLFAEFDHAKAAHNVGLSMPPITVLVFGYPKGGPSFNVGSPGSRSRFTIPGTHQPTAWWSGRCQLSWGRRTPALWPCCRFSPDVGKTGAICSEKHSSINKCYR